MYSGQQMLAGVPPYVSIFDHKAPLSLMIAWPAAFLARVVHTDDLFLVRVSCVLVGGLAAAVLYALGRELLGSRASGVFAAVFFVAMPALGRATCWGPHPKTWMLLFQVASLFFVLRRRWALAGAAAAVAGLVWQPMSVYAAGVWLVAALQRGAERRRALVLSVGGSLAVGALVAVYLGATGALAAAFDGAVVFNLKYLERDPKTLAQHFGLVGRVAMGGFGFWWPVALAGLVAHATRFVSGWRAGRSWVERLRVDPWALSLVVFPAPFLWSCIDFQGESDLFVFVPIAAVGFAYAVSALVRRFRVPVVLPLLALVACCALPWSGGKRHMPVDEQRQILEEAFAYARRELHIAPDQPLRIESVGAPEALVLLHRRNWSRYLSS